MRVGIVGKGHFGQRILSKVRTFADVHFFTGREMAAITPVDWVIVASANHSHYEVAKRFLQASRNVFLEKPPTLSYEQTKELIELSKTKGVKLYIDDVFLYNDQYQKNKEAIRKAKRFEFCWLKYGTFTDGIFNSLTYHDLYLLIDLFGKQPITGLHFTENQINVKKFEFFFGQPLIECEYNRLSSDLHCKTIQADDLLVSLASSTNDGLMEMLTKALNGTADYEANNDMALHAQLLLDQLNENKLSVAVVGAGIFGLTAALNLKKHNFDVTVFEKNPDIIQNASSINQYRLHRGYHYPRSRETACSAKAGIASFLKEYQCLSPDTIKAYYGISKTNSLVSGEQYIKFLDEMELEHKPAKLDILNQENLDILVEVNERLFDPIQLKTILLNKINQASLRIKFNETFKIRHINSFNYVINCTYANVNDILSNNDHADFQFELCEKPLVKMPDSYKNKSVVILDGPFMCIDPYCNTEYHLMGNVKHAIHSTNVGNFPIIPDEFKSLLNCGVVKNPPITNISKFIESAKVFFKDVEKLEHIGSMFTIRTVLTDREHDDARPSIIAKHNEKLYTLFSGKIPTCVDSSEELLDTILKS